MKRVGCALICAFFLSAAAAPAEVSVVRLDGSVQTGELTALDAHQAVLSVDGADIEFPIADLTEIARTDCATTTRAAGAGRFLLNDGGELAGTLIDGGREQLTIAGRLADRLTLRFEDLAGVVLAGADSPAAQKLFDDALTDRLAGQDVLITLDDAEPKALRGRLAALAPEDGAFVFNDRERTFRTSKIYGVVFARGAKQERPASALITLADGDRFTGEPRGLAEGRLTVRTAFGAEVTVPLEDVCALRWENPRVVYLDALAPQRESSAGILHPDWPIVRNGNVVRGPLRLDGRTYARGLGVHAQAEISWTLARKYETFAACVGIDEAAAPGGNARFVVLADGREVWSAGPVRGNEPVRQVRLPVADVDVLTLRVEPGADADVGDWADWADARVILPQAAP